MKSHRQDSRPALPFNYGQVSSRPTHGTSLRAHVVNTDCQEASNCRGQRVRCVEYSQAQCSLRWFIPKREIHDRSRYDPSFRDTEKEASCQQAGCIRASCDSADDSSKGDHDEWEVVLAADLFHQNVGWQQQGGDGKVSLGRIRIE